MVKVGIAGIGFMGWIHWLAYQSIPGVTVTAICEMDEKRLQGDWTDIQGNFGPPGEKVDLSEIATYRDLDEMVQDDSVDLVDICLPPSVHLQAIEAAARAACNVSSSLGLRVHALVTYVHSCSIFNKNLNISN